jgi:hypothetical protein
MTKRKKGMPFPERLAAVFERSGKTQVQVSVVAGITQPYLCQLMRGRADASPGHAVDRAVDLCRRLAKACDCEVEELLGL